MRRRWPWSVLTSLALAGALLGGSLLHQSRSELELKRSLATLRGAIGRYVAARGRPPRDLAALVESGVLVRLPPDPTTGRNDSWVVIGAADGDGFVDVRSPTESVGSDGRRYSDW